jgi:hypothetical protein
MKTKVARSMMSVMALICMIVVGSAVRVNGQSFDTELALSVSGNNQTKVKTVGPMDPFAIVVGYTFESGSSAISATMPQSFVPPVYGGGAMGSSNTSFRLEQNKEADLRAGIRIKGIFEAGVLYKSGSFSNSRPSDNPFSGEYQTLWGAYGTGNYAAIGQLEVKNSLGIYGQMQTPDINVTKHFALQAFAFASTMNSRVRFQSGYHRFASAFNPTYKSAELGSIKESPVRLGLNLNYKSDDDDWELGLKVYEERDGGGFSEGPDWATFNGKYNGPDRSKWHLGWGVVGICHW